MSDHEPSASTPPMSDQLSASNETPRTVDKVFNDPIHGSIRLNPLLVKIIDTPQFQRLRYIKQMGGCSFVYPGATHTRFEHSIGVAHLAGKLAKRLQQEQKELGITDRDVMCVTIAGLCHDLGHGPFSHIWDGQVVAKLDNAWTHEKASLIMFEHLYTSNQKVQQTFMSVWKEYLRFERNQDDLLDVLESDLEFIKELIHRDPKSDPKIYPGKKYLYEIVANKRNSIDVDKWDYFKRDCHYLGLTCSFDILRPLEFVRVIEVDGEQQICFRDKEARNIFQMFQTRELLHRLACKHKTTRIIEKLLAAAFLKACAFGFKIPVGKPEHGEVAMKKITALNQTEDGPDPEMYTHLTDHLFEMILATAPPEGDLKEAKEILKNIQERQFYKFLGEICDVTKSGDELLEEYIKYSSDKVQSKDIHPDKVEFDFANGKDNPFDAIRFFSKHDVNKGEKISLSSVSSFLPRNFQEKVVRFYYIPPTDGRAYNFDKAKSYFDEWAKELEKEKQKREHTDEQDETSNGGNGSPSSRQDEGLTTDENGAASPPAGDHLTDENGT